MNKLILTDQSSGTHGGTETDKLCAHEDIEMLRVATLQFQRKNRAQVP
jgi:hypothetical protein